MHHAKITSQCTRQTIITTAILCYTFSIHAVANTEISLIPLKTEQTATLPTQTFIPSQQANLTIADNQLPESKNSLDEQVSGYYLQQNWQALASILPIYRLQTNHDTVLADFTEAAMLRAQYHAHKAIKLYKRILSAHPSYHFVRLAYAQALFENHQYQEAEKQFAIIPTEGMHHNTVQLLKTYQNYLKQRLQPQWNAGFQYEKNDNINNASNIKTVQINGLILQKTEESLPKSATGLRYTIDLSKRFYITGHNELQATLTQSGIYYPQSTDYNEHTSYLSLGYHYSQQHHTWSLIPYYDYNLYGNKPYSQTGGFNLQYRYQPNKMWSYQIAHDISWSHYNDLPDYKTLRNESSVDMQYNQLNYTLQTSIGYRNDQTQASEYRYYLYWMSLSGQYIWKNQIGFRLSIKYSQRTNKKARLYISHTDAIRRQDKSHSIQVGLFNPKWQWHGIIPTLNWQYDNTQSNIPEIYQKQTQKWFISMKKIF